MPAPKRPSNSAAAGAKPKAAAGSGKKAPVADKAGTSKPSTTKAAPKSSAKPAKPAASSKPGSAKATPSKTTKAASAKAAPSKAAPAKTPSKTPSKTPRSTSAAAATKPATKATKAAATKPAAKATKAAPAKAADDKKAAPKTMKAEKSSNGAGTKPAFDKKFLDEQRRLLLDERARYVHHAQLYKDEADALVSEREPGDVQFDEESGEGDTLAVERDFDLALSAQARQQVDEIDAALARIDDGTYGLCRVSGKPIPKERLQAIPWATERVEFKVGGLGRR